MSQQLRQLKNRIRSVDSTWKVTRAMEMVSMSKFKASTGPLDMGRKYFERVQSLLAHLFASQTDTEDRFLRSSNGEGPLGLLVITTDAGLCGSYNQRLMDLVEEFISAHPGRQIKLYVYGRKGQAHFKKNGFSVAKSFPAVHGRPVGNFHAAILDALIGDFSEGLVDEVHVLYTVFHNAMRHEPFLQRFLPIAPPQVKQRDVIMESGSQGILTEIVPMYLSSHLRLMLLDSLTSEHSARMVAMKSAKDNAKELREDLVLLRNKMRQAMITREVIEIISSAEALKG
jgi:F-type H+-transporting ATPase subunit gamma